MDDFMNPTGLVVELFNKLMQSIEEVRQMQEEIQKTQKLHGCLLQKLMEKHNISVSDGIQFPPTLTFPFKTVAELTAAESVWGDDLLATKLVDTLAKIGGLTLRKAINRMMEFLMTDDVERQLCFVRPPPGKTAFKPLKLYDLIKRTLHRIGPTADATHAEVDNEMSKYLISSRDRHGQRHRRRKMAAVLKAEAANDSSSTTTTKMLTE